VTAGGADHPADRLPDRLPDAELLEIADGMRW